MSKTTVSQINNTEDVKVEDQNIETTTPNEIEYIDEKQLKRERRQELVAKYTPLAKRVAIGTGIAIGLGVLFNIVKSLAGASDVVEDPTVIDGDFTTDNE